MTPTHFIEHFVTANGKYLAGPIQPVGQLSQALKNTVVGGMRTVAVWKIKYKHHEQVAELADAGGTETSVHEAPGIDTIKTTDKYQ